MAQAGFIALLLALVSSVCSALAFGWGVRARQSRWVGFAQSTALFAGAAVAASTLILLWLLLSRDFQVQYVYAHTSSTQPIAYVVSALWAGEEGSFLLWLLFLAIITAMTLLQKPRWPATQWSYAMAILMSVQGVFALILISVHNPFVLHVARPLEGAGLLPALLNPGMLIHPPILFLGYALYAVPFAFSLAGLMAGLEGSDASALRLAMRQSPLRQWSLMAWLFLGLGILIGAWWAYVELGWGGYWSWDPVENASLVPWLVGTAYLHALLAEARHGTFKRWSAALAIAAFTLCIFATLVTRGGIIVSPLHGFSSSIQPVAFYLLGLILCSMAVAICLLRWRWHSLIDEREGEHLLSRESALLLTNLLLIGLAAAILLGMIFPTLLQLLQGVQMYLDNAFYNRVFGPLALSLVFLIALCTVLRWSVTSPRQLLRALRYPVVVAVALGIVLFVLGVRQPHALLAFVLIALATGSIVAEFVHSAWRRSRLRHESLAGAAWGLSRSGRRRYGARLVHLAILLMGVGIVGSAAFKTESRLILAPGEAGTVKGYTLVYENLSVLSDIGKHRFVATMGIYQGTTRTGALRPEKDLYLNRQELSTEVAILSTLREDLYIALDVLNEDDTAIFRVSVFPLIIWLWVGGGLLFLGTLVALWPDPPR